jgi:adenylate cyclase
VLRHPAELLICNKIVMGREIERKYLVRNDGWRRLAGRGTLYRQGYLSTDPDRSVRVRVGGGKAFLTIKGKSEGPARDEFEYPIPLGDAEYFLLKLCVRPLIEKTRYVIEQAKLRWEIDEFAGDNQGLLIAELEVAGDNQEFSKPDWLGDEVTGDPRYFNISLVRHPLGRK